MPATGGRPVAVAVVVGFVVAGALVWVILARPTPIDCNTQSSGSPPLGPWLAFSSPTERTLGSAHWYNSTAESVGGGLHLDNLGFEFQSAGGLAISPGVAWNLTALSAPGALIGAYSLSGANAGLWYFGGHTELVSQEALSLLTNPENLSGGSWIVNVVGLYANGCPAAGSVSVTIP